MAQAKRNKIDGMKSDTAVLAPSWTINDIEPSLRPNEIVALKMTSQLSPLFPRLQPKLVNSRKHGFRVDSG